MVFAALFGDGAAERASYPWEVAEMALAHIVSDETEAAYFRSDLFEKRRRLAEEQSRFYGTPKKSGNV